MPNASKVRPILTAELKAGKAFFRIVDAISEYGLASSAEIRSQVDSFLSQGVTAAEVFISSLGGNVFETEDIAGEFERFGNDNVEIVVGAKAASAVTYLTSTFKTKAKPNSQFMYHNPRLGTYGDISKIEADLKLLRNATANYVKRYSEKTGKSEEDIIALLAQGDVWMSAAEALEYGFIDEVLNGENAEITALDVVVLEASGAPVIPEVTEEKTTNTNMDRNVLISKLGLSADATDEQITAAVEKNRQDSVTLSAQLESEGAVKKAKAKTLVAQAVLDKKIKADLVATYENLAEQNYEGTKTVLEALIPITQLSKELLGTGDPKSKLEARAEWSFSKWQEEDPKGLEALADETPEEFTKLFNAEIKSC